MVELRGWAALREQIQLRRRGRLLEYPDEQARQVALANGLPGRPVGDRFVLLDGAAPPRIEIETRIDYMGSLPSCLSLTEDGVIALTEEAHDLLLHSQLDRWAERTMDRTWRLTAASVAAPVKAGVPVSVLFKLLQERLTHPMPPLLGVALRAWVGKTPRVELALVTVLRCRQPAVFEVIARSEKFRPYIQGALAPDMLLVDTRNVKMLQAQLAWAGIAVADALEEQ